MEAKKHRVVLVADNDKFERARQKKAVTDILKARGETAEFREAVHPAQLVEELNALKDNLVTLVVVTGFNHYWHRIFEKFAVISSDVAAIFMNKNKDLFYAADRAGFMFLPMFTRPEKFAQLVNQQLDALSKAKTASSLL